MSLALQSGADENGAGIYELDGGLLDVNNQRLSNTVLARSGKLAGISRGFRGPVEVEADGDLDFGGADAAVISSLSIKSPLASISNLEGCLKLKSASLVCPSGSERPFLPCALSVAGKLTITLSSHISSPATLHIARSITISPENLTVLSEKG